VIFIIFSFDIGYFVIDVKMEKNILSVSTHLTEQEYLIAKKELLLGERQNGRRAEER
jgi:hypothetical protein